MTMILVTGATGLNGKAIMREFARQGHEVRALVRDPDRASAAGLGGLPAWNWSRATCAGRKRWARHLMASTAC